MIISELIDVGEPKRRSFLREEKMMYGYRSAFYKRGSRRVVVSVGGKFSGSIPRTLPDAARAP